MNSGDYDIHLLYFEDLKEVCFRALLTYLDSFINHIIYTASKVKHRQSIFLETSEAFYQEFIGSNIYFTIYT